jgi:hypothetical protein
MYERFVTMAEKKHACPLCTRGFDSAFEAQFVAKVRKSSLMDILLLFFVCHIPWTYAHVFYNDYIDIIASKASVEGRE